MLPIQYSLCVVSTKVPFTSSPHVPERRGNTAGISDVKGDRSRLQDIWGQVHGITAEGRSRACPAKVLPRQLKPPGYGVIHEPKAKTSGWEEDRADEQAGSGL